MLHPSYTELIKVVNGDVEEGDTPVVNSRYSIVLATAKRARQLIDGAKSDCAARGKKPLSTAVEEMAQKHVLLMIQMEMVRMIHILCWGLAAELVSVCWIVFLMHMVILIIVLVKMENYRHRC